jgi:hypothetical protein
MNPCWGRGASRRSRTNRSITSSGTSSPAATIARTCSSPPAAGRPCARRISPGPTRTSPKRSASRAACVPFPAPGGPSTITGGTGCGAEVTGSEAPPPPAALQQGVRLRRPRRPRRILPNRRRGVLMPGPEDWIDDPPERLDLVVAREQRRVAAHAWPDRCSTARRYDRRGPDGGALCGHAASLRCRRNGPDRHAITRALSLVEAHRSSRPSPNLGPASERRGVRELRRAPGRRGWARR